MFLRRLNRFLARHINVRPARLAGKRPIASIGFDDFPKSAWTVGGAILARHNVRGTYYTAGSFCGRTVDGMEFYDAADLKALAAAGHEIACHGYGHQQTPTLSTPELEQDWARNTEFLKPFLNGAAPVSYAYPYGAVSLRTKKFYAPRFTNVRGVHPGVNEGEVDLSQLNAVSLESRCWNKESVRSAIEQVKRNRGWIALYTHDVSDNPSPYGSTPQMLSDALAMVKEAGIEILPMRDAVKVAVG